MMCLKNLRGVCWFTSLKFSFVKNLFEIQDPLWIPFLFLSSVGFVWQYFVLSANSQFSHSNNFEYSTWSTLVTANLWKMRSYSKETIFPSKQVSCTFNQNIHWNVSFYAKDTYPCNALHCTTWYSLSWH